MVNFYDREPIADLASYDDELVNNIKPKEVHEEVYVPPVQEPFKFNVVSPYVNDSYNQEKAYSDIEDEDEYYEDDEEEVIETDSIVTKPVSTKSTVVEYVEEDTSPEQYVEKRQFNYSIVAILAFVAALTQLVFFSFIIPTLVAIILGHIGLKETRFRNKDGRILAVFALIFGYIGLAVLIVLGLGVVLFAGLILGAGGVTTS
jgi:hypothetical protein